MNTICNITILSLSLIEYYLFNYVIYKKKAFFYKYKIPYINLFILLAMVIFESTIIKNQLNIFIAIEINAAIMMCLFYRQKIKQSVKDYIVAFGIIHLFQEFGYQIFSYNTNIEKKYINILEIICSIVLFLLVYILITRKMSKDVFVVPSKVFWLFAISLINMNFLLSYAGTAFNFLTNKKLRIFGSVVLIVAVFTTIIFIFGLLYYYNNNEKNKIYLDAQKEFNKQQREYYENMLEVEEETRRFRHDIIDNLLEIQFYNKEHKNEKVDKYISSMLKDLASIQKNSYDVGNDTINTILNYYTAIMPENTKIKIRGNTKDVNIDDYDLCLLVSNIVKNAYDAIKIIKSENKLFDFYIKQGSRFLSIELTNTFETKNYFITNDFTGKDDVHNHGYGVHIINSLVKKYNGTYDKKIIGDRYTIKVVIEQIGITDMEE